MQDTPLVAYNTTRQHRRKPRFRVLRGLVFFPLLWLRFLVQGLLSLLTGFTLIGGIAICAIAALSRHHHYFGWNLWTAAAALFAASFLGFMARFFYDSILIRLNPTERTFFFY